MSLNQKQKMFVEAYAKTGNATQSYIDAGYKSKDEESAKAAASRLLTNGNVKEALSKLNEKTEKSTIATLEEIREFHSSTLRDEGLEYQFRQKAADMLTKMGGGYLEKVEHSGKIDINSIAERLTGK